MFYEGIVLLGRTLGEGLEPVSVVCGTHLLSPLLHALGYGICDGAVEACTVVNHVDEFVINICGQVLVHLLTVEYVLAKVFGGTFGRGCHFYSFLLEGLFHYLES